MKNAPTEDDCGWIKVFNDCEWPRGPRFVELSIYIDGVVVGSALLGSQRITRVSPGQHTLQVGFRRYRSPVVDVLIRAGEVARFGTRIQITRLRRALWSVDLVRDDQREASAW